MRQFLLISQNIKDKNLSLQAQIRYYRSI